jgi:hypothetical protein
MEKLQQTVHHLFPASPCKTFRISLNSTDRDLLIGSKSNYEDGTISILELNYWYDTLFKQEIFSILDDPIILITFITILQFKVFFLARPP